MEQSQLINSIFAQTTKTIINIIYVVYLSLSIYVVVIFYGIFYLLEYKMLSVRQSNKLSAVRYKSRDKSKVYKTKYKSLKAGWFFEIGKKELVYMYTVAICCLRWCPQPTTHTHICAPCLLDQGQTHKIKIHQSTELRLLLPEYRLKIGLSFAAGRHSSKTSH